MMQRRLLVAPVLAVAVFALANFALAAPTAKPATKKFNAALNVGQETGVVKATQRGASGQFTATLSGSTLTWKLSFSHLSGPATAAHIHGPAARHVSAGVLVALCGPCSSPLSGTSTLTAAQISNLESGKTYVNVHTAKNPNGEIRGQVTAVG